MPAGPAQGCIETTEGSTRLLVPEGSLGPGVPPREPAFFNPRARANRDTSMAAYSAHLRGLHDAVLLDCMSGLGARGLRAANEVGGIEVCLNDTNEQALNIARESAKLNCLDCVSTSNAEACSFLAEHWGRGKRAAIVDIDPFGSPAPHLDCCLRAVSHGGMLSITATDLQVLNGIFPDACRRIYGGSPARAVFGAEAAVRLLLGCLRNVAARLGVSFEPLLTESDQHYYRSYVRVLARRDTSENMGFLYRCVTCGDRGASPSPGTSCPCGGTLDIAGPLWTGPLFEGRFLNMMLEEAGRLPLGEKCAKRIETCIGEQGLPPAYYTLDEMASRCRASPPKRDFVIEYLRGRGYSAGPTSFDPSGFRTDAPVSEVRGAF
ncbi:N2,N2-dimethylguanosine tRNA methyltransferase [Cenarchaeum symbiosum A]|uniref:tRNA (guanine(26)-N(2))-dimethyltransferase n=1 Tax=Cenarchaeum symbiosum (strain A) TaxID=414004 RepID=A0RV27_CENSY|nr:N2,N2-dimethylguanosine tRNA methyltransferase [Cenarchaeum symbiosum A]